MNLGVIAIWSFLGLVVVCVTLASHFGRLETERTLRQAIDKGLPLDPPAIERLKRAASMPWAIRLTAIGIFVLFLAAAGAGFALILALQEPESLAPLLAIAAFVGLTGLGLLVCGQWLRRVWKEPVP